MNYYVKKHNVSGQLLLGPLRRFRKKIMKRNPYRATTGFKGALIVVAVLIIILLLFYVQHVVDRLRGYSTDIVKVYAHLVADAASGDSNVEYTFIFDQIIKKIDFPIVNSDSEKNPTTWRNLDIENTLDEENIQKVREIMAAMDAENEPIPIMYEDYVLGFIHYDTDSELIQQLKWFPFVEIAIVGVFIVLGYLGFSQVKVDEQRSIWIGMAKETAHQLGTPISSLMGWTQLLEEQATGRESTLKIIDEMRVDIDRLDRITSRFSKIGSKTDLKKQALVPIVRNTVNYFRKRLPSVSKKILIEERYDSDPEIDLNKQLFEWVIENLLKNSIDAIEAKSGTISVSVMQSNGEINIDVSDNGKGIEMKNRKNIFRPGYSTKNRGWGLGLSLVKRIVEDYHGGKIILKDSRMNDKTTFRITFRNDEAVGQATAESKNATTAVMG